jgi:hypothetical protein
MADQAKEKMEDVRSYAAKHPRRMQAGAAMLGMMAGASIMAAKKQRAKTPMEKFMEKMSK